MLGTPVSPIMPVGSTADIPYPLSGTGLISLSGWLWYRANGNTLGSVASMADVADARAEQLFLALWTNPDWNVLTNTGAAIAKGASAAADWAANRRLVIPDMRGRTVVTAGQAPGFNNYVTGSTFGTEDYILDVDEMPQHNHATGFWYSSNEALGWGLAASNIFGDRVVVGSPYVDQALIEFKGLGLPFSLIQPSIAMEKVLFTGVSG